MAAAENMYMPVVKSKNMESKKWSLYRRIKIRYSPQVKRAYINIKPWEETFRVFKTPFTSWKPGFSPSVASK